MINEHASAQPMLRVMGTLMLAAVVLGGSGCARHLYSPPTQFMPIEDAFGPTQGGVNVGLSGSTSGAVFGPGLAAANVHVDVGVSERIDVVGEGTWMRLTTSGEAPLGNPSRDGAAGRGGLRLTLLESRVRGGRDRPPLVALALTTGVGGGVSALGTYVAPDVGVALSVRSYAGFDLTVGARSWTSVPVVRHTLTWSDGERSNEPAPSFGGGVTLQAGIPLLIDESRAGHPRLRAVVGVGVAYVGDGADDVGFLQIGGGLEAAVE